MYCIGELFGLDKHNEVLLIILTGFGISVFDSSLFYMKRNIEQIWDLALDIRIYPIMHQIYIKYILTAVVLTRTFTLHLCLALYVVMLWPAVFRERHNLLLPWLTVGILRYLLANLTTLILGSYLCITHEGVKPVCFEYVLAQFIDHGPAVYSWFVVLSFYQDLRHKSKEDVTKQNEMEVQQLLRRKKARSMALHLRFDELDDGRNLISESTIGTLLHHLQNTVITKSRSLDSLLAFKAAEEEKEELMNTEDFLEERENKAENNICERAKKLLNLVSEDIIKAKREKSDRTLKILSDITLDALTFVGTSRLLSKVSSASFFIKNGVAYRYKNVRFLPSRTIDAYFYDCIEEENAKQNENELVNMFLETDKKHK